MQLHFELILLSHILVGSVDITFPPLKSARFFFDHLLEWEQNEAQLSIFSSVGSNLIQTWAAQFGCTAWDAFGLIFIIKAYSQHSCTKSKDDLFLAGWSFYWNIEFISSCEHVSSWLKLKFRKSIYSLLIAKRNLLLAFKGKPSCSWILRIRGFVFPFLYSQRK